MLRAVVSIPLQSGNIDFRTSRKRSESPSFGGLDLLKMRLAEFSKNNMNPSMFMVEVQYTPKILKIKA